MNERVSEINAFLIYSFDLCLAVYGEPYNGSDAATMDDEYDDGMYHGEYPLAADGAAPGQPVGSNMRNNRQTSNGQPSNPRSPHGQQPQSQQFNNLNQHGRRTKGQHVSRISVG